MFDQPTPLHFLILAFWLISGIADYGEYCYLWQLKEYRLDRFRDFLGTKTGRMYWLRYSMFWRSAAAIVALLWPINSHATLHYILLAILVADMTRFIILLLRRRWQHPKPTVKAILIIFTALTACTLFVVLSGDPAIPFVALILRFFFFSVMVQIFQVATLFVKRLYIISAKKKLARYPNLIVIGITGSYGKSSVKHFLTQILRHQFRVSATPKNVNTDIGVAKVILQTDFAYADIFVVEMGAYRKGEIAAICRMVRPKIGILTAINAQHISLFGSIQNIHAAKFELLQSLPADGLAIANSDNDYCRQGLKDLKAKVKTFGGDEKYKPDCHIMECRAQGAGIEVTVALAGDVITFTAPVLGAHNAGNIAACILAAAHLGMSLPEIVAAIKTLQAPEHTLRSFTFGRSIVIDDSYNANPDGFHAALDVLRAFGGNRRRIVITRGIPELGAESDHIHEDIGSELSYAADIVVLVSRDFETPLRRGIGNKLETEVMIKEEAGDLLKYVKTLRDISSVILIENRVADVVYRELMS